MASLTSKHQVFAKEYIADRNAKQAAIRAGYSERTAKQQGSRLLTYVDVQAAIEAERGRMRERSDLVADDVIQGLRQIAEDETAPHSSRVQAWKILGQHMGMFTERIQVEHGVDLAPLKTFTIAELFNMREMMMVMPEPVEAEARVLEG
jgi:hypothetical protein